MKISTSCEKYKFENLVIVHITSTHVDIHSDYNLKLSRRVSNNSRELFSVSPVFQGHYSVRTSILKFKDLTLQEVCEWQD